MVSLDRCNGSCNTPDDPISVSNKTKDINVFHIITKINESRTLTKIFHISCKFEFYASNSNSNQYWNNDFCRHQCKNSIKHRVCKENYAYNPSSHASEFERYFKSIAYDLVVTCNENFNVMDTVAIN